MVVDQDSRSHETVSASQSPRHVLGPSEREQIKMDPSGLVGRSSRTVSKLGSSLLPKSSAGWSLLLSRYLFIAVFAYLLLAAAGPAAPGPLGVGFVQSIKNYLIYTLAYFIVAWGLVSRNKNGMALYSAGLFLLTTAAYLILNNLPISSGSPSWVSNGKTGLVNLSLYGSQGLIAATAAIVAL